MSEWWRNILPRDRGERLLAGRLALVHALLLAGFTIARAARDGVYLGELPAQTLPYLYIVLAVLTGLALLRRREL